MVKAAANARWLAEAAAAVHLRAAAAAEAAAEWAVAVLDAAVAVNAGAATTRNRLNDFRQWSAGDL